jgi:exopolysaccharide production protein ExoZ
MGVGLLYQRKSPILFAPRMAPLWLILAIVFMALAFAVPESVAPGPVTDFPFTFAAASLIMLGLSLEERLPKWNFGIVLGDASYSMYLVHMYLVAISIIVVRKLMGTTVPWLDVALSVGLSVIAAVAIHRFVDKPIHKALRRLDRSAQRPRQPESAA